MSVVELDLIDRGLPRRLSVIPGTDDYDDSARSRFSDRVRVFLDGKELAEVAAWNVDDGVIVRNRRSADGRLVLSGEDRAPILERRQGKVEVRWVATVSPAPAGGAAA